MANSSNFGFGIFRREWAYWAWEIYWYEGTTKVHGSDGGLFVKEERPLHRLRERFFYGVVLNKHRSGKAYSELVERFEVYYINTESRQKTGIDYQHDFHMFTLTYADKSGTPSLLVKPTAQAYTLLRDNMDFLLQITAEANLVIQQKTQAATSMQSRLNMLAKPVTDPRPGQPGYERHLFDKMLASMTDANAAAFREHVQPLSFGNSTMVLETKPNYYHFLEQTEAGEKLLKQMMKGLCAAAGKRIRIEYKTGS